MITNADNYVPVRRTNQCLTPFNTGKVQIGLLYQPPPPEMTSSEEIIQAALLGVGSIHSEPPLWPLVLGSAIVSFLLIYFAG